jgi:hypothetical protein
MSPLINASQVRTRDTTNSPELQKVLKQTIANIPRQRKS